MLAARLLVVVRAVCGTLGQGGCHQALLTWQPGLRAHLQKWTLAWKACMPTV